jgi:hypothetical protein
MPPLGGRHSMLFVAHIRVKVPTLEVVAESLSIPMVLYHIPVLTAIFEHLTNPAGI